ncbi:MAG: type II toxin-antitoxin system VapC family toxin [Leptolyngbya sp. IPPAS B-1204]|jgi:predicted nucleic acid-binding protein|nr:MAG: PIN domain-containing protein [Leptolyngbya sp. IPPAS B-1204]
MRQSVLLDTGPLVALLKQQDHYHEWAKAEWANIKPPLLTCESVITEACFLMRDVYRGQEVVLALLQRGAVQISFRLDEEVAALERLLTRYRSVPMSLADACLVRMAEQYRGSAILTLDSDFQIYRKDTNQVIPVIMPPV